MIAFVLFENFDQENLLGWAALLAASWDHDLLIIRATRRPADDVQRMLTDPNDLPENLKPAFSRLLKDFALKDSSSNAETPANKRTVQFLHLEARNLSRAIADIVREFKPRIVVVPRSSHAKLSSPDLSVQHDLLTEITSTVVLLAPGTAQPDQLSSILVPVGHADRFQESIHLAKKIGETAGAKIRAVYVEPNVDVDAEQVGQRILQKALVRAVGVSEDAIESKVIVHDSVLSGLREAINGDTDLVVMGMQQHGVVHRFFFRSVSEELTLLNLGPAIIVVRPEFPLADRFVRIFDRLLKATVPQIERDDRIKLVERIQTNSLWNFDFVALICLSTLIAAGGLIQNSPAVVIGAMLVAPLMTPLLGAGLALVHANRVFFGNALLSVARGFLLAFVLSMIVGLSVPHPMTDEMAARGSPGIFDLFVAFVSGIAAAYASGRPNLLSALPGVAIAASLVPPIATAGIAIASGNPRLATGSALLFLTNILAIILGTATSFWAIGIRQSHKHGGIQKWSTLAFMALVVCAFGLGIYESTAARIVSGRARSQIEQVAEEYGVRLDRIEFDKKTSTLVVQLRSAQPIDQQVSDAIASQARQSVGRPIAIRVDTTLSQDYR